MLQAILAQAIDESLSVKRAGGVFDTAGCARLVIQHLIQADPEGWSAIRAEIVLESITVAIQRRLNSLAAKTDDRQGWLALPEYQRVPQLIKVEGGIADVNEVTLEQYRESESELRERIKSYNYPRRSPLKLERDKETLAQMMKLDRSVSPFMAGDPEMKIGRGVELRQAALETPAGRRNRKGGKARQAAKRRINNLG